MTIATTTEYGTDEDTESGSRITRSIFDNFMRRPSVMDEAIQAIAAMANNDQLMMRADEDERQLFDAAFVFLDRGQARFLISGCAAAYYFDDGALAQRSDPAEAPAFGAGPKYEARLEPVFSVDSEKPAFLAASRTLAAVPDADIERALCESSTPAEWMEKLKALVGEDKQFCAVTAFLPPEKPSRIQGIFHGKK